MTVVRRTRKGGFTLVEILIVVIILGILAAIVIPQFTSASQDARKNSLTSQLQTLRSQIELYKLQHLDQPPANLMNSSSTTPWVELINKTNDQGATGTSTAHPFGPYLQSEPRNPLNGFTGVLVGSTEYDGAGDALSGAAGKGFVVNTNNTKIWGTSAKCGFVSNEALPSDTNNDN